MHHEDLSRSLAGSLLEVLAAAPALSRREVQLVLHEHSPVVCIECRHRVAYVQVIFERDERAPRGFVRYAVFTLEKGADRPRQPMRVLHFSGAEFGALHGYVTSTLTA